MLEGLRSDAVVTAVGAGDDQALVFEPSQPGALFQRIKKLIGDDSLRRQIARAGHARVQSLRWSVAVERLESLYQTWLAEIRQRR